ncbi:MAG: PQQ-dependent sugar dehydrogenase [Ardenticatenaceae bacterium]
MFNMKRMLFGLLLVLLLALPQWLAAVSAAPARQAGSCLFFSETVQGEGGFSVCDDAEANFRTPFEAWGLQKVGYPISRRYVRDGFVTQAFQKAIMQWRSESNSVVLVNIFDDLHNDGFDDTLLATRQTPKQLPDGWDGDISFGEVVEKRQALLDERAALREVYFASSDPLTFYGLPTSEVEDMGNHYAVRLQRAVLQEWKEEVPWASLGEVTIANGGDIAKELGGLPSDGLVPEAASGGSSPPAATPTAPPAPTATVAPAGGFDANNITIALEAVVEGLRNPVAVVSAGDGSGRLFVAEKGGTIRIVEGGQLLSSPFLNVNNLLSTGREQGLLGLAFEPDRPERFYINYTNRDGDTVIARYRVSNNRNVADPNSAEILLTVEQPAVNHNAGHLLFGPDGYLWIALGDGGGAGDRFENGQNANTLLGSMLRLDVRSETGYNPAPGNPFANGMAWAIGLRNPWRYSFDRLTGDLWIGDVGQGEWEEINRVSSTQAGANYGWPILEGDHCYNASTCQRDGFIQPITEYDHSFGCSVTGGNVYRGEQYPQLQGGYFFADYCSGVFWVIDATSQSLTQPTIVLESGLTVSSFGEDEAGELYITAFDGTLYRLVAR